MLINRKLSEMGSVMELKVVYPNEPCHGLSQTQVQLYLVRLSMVLGFALFAPAG